MADNPSPSRWSPLLADCSTVWIMATVAVVAGFVINQFRDTPLPLVYVSKEERMEVAVNRIAQGALPETEQVTSPGNVATEQAEVQDIELEEFCKMREENPDCIVLDARPEIFHRLGRVPKALSLPREDFEASYTKHRAVLEKDKSQMILVYCSGGHCYDGQMVADGLIKLGYTNVYLFKTGWSAWIRAKLPEERNQ